MTVQQIDTGQVAGLRPAVVGLHAAIDTVAAAPVAVLSDEQVAVELTELARAETRVAARKLDVLAEADRRQLAEQAAATGTDAWAAPLVGSTRGMVAGGLWLARLLEDRYAATRQALDWGGVTVDQARVIVHAAEQLPDQVTDEDRARAEVGLVEQAINGADPRRLRIAARRMLAVISIELADQHEACLLTEEERRAENETWLSLVDNGNGTSTGKFVIPDLHATMLRAALERLTAPRRHGRDKAGNPTDDPSADDGFGGGLGYPDKLGRGFCELIEHLPTTGHAAVAADVVIHLDYQHLLDGLASAGLDTGVKISAGAARRLACGAGIIPAVLGGVSLPLDLGRESRLHTKAQRVALSLLHDSCAVAGCERPFAWTEIHHPHAWSEGGPTSLDNALPLCGHHHRRAHDDRFRLKLHPNREATLHRRT